MPSMLTRSVFRKLLSKEGLVHHCINQSTQVCHGKTGYNHLARQRQCRGLFGFSKKAAREARVTDLVPGLSKMLDLSLMEKVQARPPSPSDLALAFKTYFAYKSRKAEAVNQIQAQHALRTFRRLREASHEEQHLILSIQDLRTARDVLLKLPEDDVVVHNTFSREIYQELDRRSSVEGTTGEMTITDLQQFLIALTLTGDSKEARTYVESFWLASPQDGTYESRRRTGTKLWTTLLQGFAREGDSAALLEAVSRALEMGVPYSADLQEILVTHFADKDDLPNMKAWFGRDAALAMKPKSSTLGKVLDSSIRNKDLEWCNVVFKKLIESSPDKPTWDVIFKWAVGALDKGVEDIEHMTSVMRSRAGDDAGLNPDMDTINGLVEFAISRNDAYLAERFLALGTKLGIAPNAKTYILQMNYRIDVGDLRGAQAAYQKLQGEDTTGLADLPVVNRYLRALCLAKSPNADLITSVFADLDERKTRLEPDTVSSLCMWHTRRDELHDVLDILNTHTFHFTVNERARIRDTLMNYCLDRANSTDSVWDVYTIMRQIFDEMDIAMRTKLMTEFFQRGRGDMAVHTFGHMRQHIQQQKRPSVDTYILCLEGIAGCQDLESLDIIHNMMKMDTSIEPSTRLYNALMLAYTACDEPYRALEYWTDITNSREGPSYRSIEIVFRACQIQPFGDKTAKDIWNKMRRMDIEITPTVFAAYVGALSGQGLLDDAKVLVRNIKTDVGLEPDVNILGTMYNAVPGQSRKDEVAIWASDAYPEVWADLEKLGKTATEEGDKLFNLARNTST